METISMETILPSLFLAFFLPIWLKVLFAFQFKAGIFTK